MTRMSTCGKYNIRLKADSHPNSTIPRHRNNMNVHRNKNTEDSQNKKQTFIKGTLSGKCHKKICKQLLV